METTPQEPGQPEHDQESDPPTPDSEGQVSEVANLDPDRADEPIAPDDATAGYPDGESGEPDEGTAGPNARPRDDRPNEGLEDT